MPTETKEENPTMLERMAGENETLRARVIALIIKLVLDVMGGDRRMTFKAVGVKSQARDIMGVLEARRMGALMDISLNKATTQDLCFHVRDSGVDRLTIIDENGQPRHLIIGSSAFVDRALDTRDGRRAVGALVALRKVAFLSAARLDALRASLATDTEELEEGYAPASKSVMEAFGLEAGSTVRYVALENSLLMSGNLTTDQGLQRYSTASHLNLNSKTVLDWLKVGVKMNAFYCSACSKEHVHGTRPNGKPKPVNWSRPAVIENTVTAQVAARWGIPQEKTGKNRCPTCDTPAWALSRNGNTAHLPLLTFNGKTCEGVATTDFGAVRAVSFRMDKESWKVLNRAEFDKATPTDAVQAMMNARVSYRVKGKEWSPARLVPVWFHHQGEDGTFTDRLGLALEPLAHAGGESGDINTA